MKTALEQPRNSAIAPSMIGALEKLKMPQPMETLPPKPTALPGMNTPSNDVAKKEGGLGLMLQRLLGGAKNEQQPESAMDLTCVKQAASMMDALRALKATEGSHLLGTALYAPLVAADAMEAMHQRRAGKSGVVPALAGTALAVMMAQHAAPALEHFMQKLRPTNPVRRALSTNVSKIPSALTGAARSVLNFR